jgi:Spy/CpxP family protein refolding chaperone
MTPPTAPRRPRGRLLATVVLLLVALAGGLAGIALDRRVLLPRLFGPRFEHGLGHHPPREFRKRLARELGLTAEQQTRIDSIMSRQGQELRAIRRGVQPQLDSIISRTRRELDSVLTPEQREKAQEIRRRHPRPPGLFQGGPPPSAAGDSSDRPPS